MPTTLPERRARHYCAGQMSLHVTLRGQWALVIRDEFIRQERAGLITRQALQLAVNGDKAPSTFRRDFSSIMKMGTRHAEPLALPGFNRLLTFAGALGIAPATLSPQVAA